MNFYKILAILKVPFMILFATIAVVVGTLPSKLHSFKTNNVLQTLGVTFAGALFINFAILHTLPESADTIKDYLQDRGPDKEIFPLANLLVLWGFLVTFFFTLIISTIRTTTTPINMATMPIRSLITSKIDLICQTQLMKHKMVKLRKSIHKHRWWLGRRIAKWHIISPKQYSYLF